MNAVSTEVKRGIERGLRRLAVRPDWLEAALDSERVLQSMRRNIPEAASGEVSLVDCYIPRLVLKAKQGRWTGPCQLTVEGAQPFSHTGSLADSRLLNRRVEAGQQTLLLRLTLAPPGAQLQPRKEEPGNQPFGSEGWTCRLPELGLSFELQPPPPAIEGLPRLMEPEQARALLETALSTSSPAYAGLHIWSCQPQMLNHKPGSRATLLYRLVYTPEGQGHGWPTSLTSTASAWPSLRWMQAIFMPRSSIQG